MTRVFLSVQKIRLLHDLLRNRQTGIGKLRLDRLQRFQLLRAFCLVCGDKLHKLWIFGQFIADLFRERTEGKENLPCHFIQP